MKDLPTCHKCRQRFTAERERDAVHRHKCYECAERERDRQRELAREAYRITRRGCRKPGITAAEIDAKIATSREFGEDYGFTSLGDLYGANRPGFYAMKKAGRA